MSDDFSIEIKRGDQDGVNFSDFTSGFVKLSMENVSSEFQFNYVDLRLDLNKPPPILVGDECLVLLKAKPGQTGQRIVTGYIDDVSIQYDADKISFTARGRSKTGDLEDCSAIKPDDKSGKWRHASVERIAKDICKPFGVDVLMDFDTEIGAEFKRFAIDPGETAIDTIERAAARRGFHVWTDAFGGLIIGEAGNVVLRDVLIEYGKSILSGERFDSRRHRYSEYVLKAQRAGTNKKGKRVVSTLSAEVFDDAIERYRPLLVVTTGQGGREGLKKRAAWERNRRAGQSERLIYRVNGFGFGNEGELWRPNLMVPIHDPRLGVKDDRLLTNVVFKINADGADGGRVSELTFARKEAFLREPYPTPGSSRSGEGVHAPR